jgi:hypothetical protein
VQCSRCGSELTRPGEYCLVCHTANADGVVLDIARERVELTAIRCEEVLGTTTVTTSPETGEREVVELRNFAGRVADELQRRRPEAVYAAGDRAVLDEIRSQVHFPFYRVEDEDPVGSALASRGEPDLEVVDLPTREKIGGSHSTLIGGRDGLRVIETVAGHPNVKKVIPGPIDAGGSGSRSGLRAKATRAGADGNLRLLVRDGSSVQENRVVTTAPDRETGERIREDVNEVLSAAGLRE